MKNAARGNHVECTHDWHDFLNVAWQPVDVRKMCKTVMKVKLSKMQPIKCMSKTFANLIMKKIGLKNMLNLSPIVYIKC